MNLQALTARKSIEEIVGSGEGEEQELSKTLTLSSITAMGIGAIIGAGIFVLTGTAAAKYAGPAIMLSFVLGGIACGFVGLCYSELSAMIPVSGSSYTYTTRRSAKCSPGSSAGISFSNMQWARRR